MKECLSSGEGVIRKSVEEFDTSSAPEVASWTDLKILIFTRGYRGFFLVESCEPDALLPQLPETVKNSLNHFLMIPKRKILKHTDRLGCNKNVGILSFEISALIFLLCVLLKWHFKFTFSVFFGFSAFQKFQLCNAYIMICMFNNGRNFQ